MSIKNSRVFLNLNKTIITYSWATDVTISHKISGHVFEAIDYFLNLSYEDKKNHIILIPETLKQRTQQIITVIKDKYKIKFHEEIFENLMYGRPKFIKAPKVILCDGVPPASTISADLELWLCSRELWWVETKNKQFSHTKIDPRLFTNTFDNLIIRYHKDIHSQTIRELKIQLYANKKINTIYDDTFVKEINPRFYNNFSCDNDYSEKTNPLLKEPGSLVKVLVYATGNCRSIGDLIDPTNEQYLDIFDTIDIIKKDYPNNKLQILYLGSNDKDLEFIKYLNNYTEKQNMNLMVISEDAMPVLNFHNQFDVYLYTPTAKNWDCNPRLVKECLCLNKPIYLTQKVKDNLDTNLGLKFALTNG